MIVQDNLRNGEGVTAFSTRPAARPPHRASAMVFEDPASRALLVRLRQLAPSGADTLIVGETGTGKELVARFLHDNSPRARRPFVAVNCGAIAETLVDSELFGHEKGAFTGAMTAEPGWFEAADGGTLFLDEIGELPLPMQVKLLRVLQEREVVRVGSRRPIPVNVRIVAATNVRLDDAVASGRFRQDLYYRIKVAAVLLPPLRARPGDILPLADHFLSDLGARGGRPGLRLAPEAMQALLDHPWPGNIRELENVIHSALVTAAGDVITRRDVTLDPFQDGSRGGIAASGLAITVQDSLKGVLGPLFDQGHGNLFGVITDAVIRSAYDYCGGNQMQTARLLGISRNVLRGHLSKLGLVSPRSRLCKNAP
ncbi:sigma-54-specific transcriptional regulator [Azospirillum fermentarium]|uniref:sigma-54 interaction domain-containing protein n=1 Tax=Azospirillum fermentarium TaxID=1233114 RepID=UPI0022272583|nr:sigma-54 dependent transcriptional regulator [Azospirillum fermentarium]MCW2248241.1 sigma-54-specific transcriptional regulator [Azospirillum fermentarium]